MFNARDLLGQYVSTQLNGPAEGRLNHAMGARPDSSGSDGSFAASSPLGDLLGGLLGGRSGLGGGSGLGGLLGGLSGGAGGGGLSDITRRADELFPGAGATLQDKNQLAMGGLAALAGAVLGGRAAGTGGALGAGLLALLGSLAYGTMKNRPASEPAKGVGMQQPLPGGTVKLPVGLREPETAEEEQDL